MIRDLPLPAPEDATDERLLRALAREGWICIGASPLPADPEGTPRFAYTAGLERTWDHPELIMLGVDWPHSRELLAAAVERVAAGETFAPGRRCPGLLPAGDAAFVEVSHAHRFFNLTYARWLYGGADFRALQLVWPDAAGRYPWDEGFEQIRGHEQEDLSEDVDAVEAAAERGDAAAAKRAGDVWWRYAGWRAAERFYRQAVAGGRDDALVGLALTLEATGDSDAALAALTRAARGGHAEAARHLDRLGGA